MDIVGSGSSNNFDVSSSSSSSKGGGDRGGGRGAGGVTTVSSDSSSLNGLKFGQKIYFEDVGIGVATKSGAGPSSICVPDGIPLSPPTPVTSRNRRNVVQGGQPPRCQVEGCQLDLSDIKAYYSRHKVCAMHSKTPKVIVAGLEQRFCQQCSRFHQLPEFDQGKRSCRRRLAGHNERRRKPQPGSLLSSRYGRLSASLQEDSSRGGGFVMDFAAYPRMSGRDSWTTTRTTADQPTATGKFLALQYPPSNVFYQGSHTYMQGSSAAGGSVFSSSRIPPGECFAGVSDSGCALSLLSNQSWNPRNNQASSSLSVNNLMNGEGAPMVPQSTAPNQSAVSNNFTVSSWAFKGNDEGGGRGNSHELHHHDLGLGQVTSQPMNTNHQFSGGQLELAHHAAENRQYMELAHSRAYDTSSAQQMHWSL